MSQSSSLTAQILLTLGGERTPVSLTVPAGPARLQDLLPMLAGFADQIVEAATRADAQQGQAVSCRKGCGVCCNQLVPISEAEAWSLHELICHLPEARRATVRARMAKAQARLQAAGLLEALLDHQPETSEGRQRLGLDYFALGLPCPFLEDQACSIHPQRPIACREYLVTTDAGACACPTAETVRCVPMPRKLSAAITQVGHDGPPRWLPLMLADAWAEGRPKEPAVATGPELLKAILARLMA